MTSFTFPHDTVQSFTNGSKLKNGIIVHTSIDRYLSSAYYLLPVAGTSQVDHRRSTCLTRLTFFHPELAAAVKMFTAPQSPKRYLLILEQFLLAYSMLIHPARIKGPSCNLVLLFAKILLFEDNR